ncbi:hypothetical protein EVJ58_g1125 [Rhodofomes roseus]|uniref:Uncharacterized protein n=1 Tax=Rhodofomes roseus TaxID=34475 RepID=A0A4Y9Z0Q5_9APHY|nr:hypothetical protein EVJ58_g1125 [Rhodofomes roseus]
MPRFPFNIAALVLAASILPSAMTMPAASRNSPRHSLVGCSVNQSNYDVRLLP